MGFPYKYLSSLIILVAIPTTALAQSTPEQPVRGETIPEAYRRAFFTNAPDFYRDRSLLRQLNTFFGIGSITRNGFPENEYVRDAQLINILYQDTLQQQVGITIRTPDLQNPYDSSLFSQPPLPTSHENDTLPEAGDVNQNEIDTPPDLGIPPEDSPIENDLESETETPEVVPFE